MNSEVYYYLFSVATFYVFMFHLWNTIYLKLNGKTFKKGTSEYEDVKKFTNRRFITVIVVALIFSLVNLAFAVRDVLQSFDERRAAAVLVIYAFMALVGIVAIVLTLRSFFGDNAGSQSTTKRNDKDDDW